MAGILFIPNGISTARITRDQEQLAGQMPHQMPQKIHDLLSFDRTCIHAKIEVEQSDASDGGEVVPVEMVLEDRSLSFGSPSPDPMWLLRDPALVDKD